MRPFENDCKMTKHDKRSRAGIWNILRLLDDMMVVQLHDACVTEIDTGTRLFHLMRLLVSCKGVWNNSGVRFITTL